MADVSNERRAWKKREIRILSPAEFHGLIEDAIARGTYNPNKKENHICQLCGEWMPAIHAKSVQDGTEMCERCAATRGGCTCPRCERMRLEDKERERAADDEELTAQAERDEAPPF